MKKEEGKMLPLEMVVANYKQFREYSRIKSGNAFGRDKSQNKLPQQPRQLQK